MFPEGCGRLCAHPPAGRGRSPGQRRRGLTLPAGALAAGSYPPKTLQFSAWDPLAASRPVAAAFPVFRVEHQPGRPSIRPAWLGRYGFCPDTGWASLDRPGRRQRSLTRPSQVRTTTATEPSWRSQPGRVDPPTSELVWKEQRNAHFASVAWVSTGLGHGSDCRDGGRGCVLHQRHAHSVDSTRTRHRWASRDLPGPTGDPQDQARRSHPAGEPLFRLLLRDVSRCRRHPHEERNAHCLRARSTVWSLRGALRRPRGRQWRRPTLSRQRHR